MEEWMKDLSPNLKKLPINELIIPGSHNSFSSKIDSTCQISPDADPQWHRIGRVFGKLGRYIIAKWSRTQSHDIFTQLNWGVRYFDLRIAVKNLPSNRGDASDVDYQFVHGLYAGSVINELKKIDEFLRSRSSEIVLLDFNHFYNMQDCHHQEFVQALRSVFSNLICHFDPIPPSLDQLRRHGKQVLIFYHHKIVSSMHDLWPGKYMLSYWPNTARPNLLLAYLNNRFHSCAEDADTGQAVPYFRVFQGILTPDANFVLKHLFIGLKVSMADKINPIYIDWLQEISQNQSYRGLNISLIDFVDADNVQSVIELNNPDIKNVSISR